MVVVTYTGFHPHMLDNTNYAYVKLDNSQIIDIQKKNLLPRYLCKNMLQMELIISNLDL